MRAVLDASAAVEIVLNRSNALVLAQVLREADDVLAPDLFLPETVNAIWKHHEFEGLGLEICDQALQRLPQLVNRLIPSIDLYYEAFRLARTLHKAVYDMFYLALAEREDATLLTLDSALKREAGRLGIRTA